MCVRNFDVDRHHVFEVPVDRTILDHPDFAVALDDLRLDLANFLIDQNTDVLLAADNRFARFDHAVWTKRISGARPAERRLALLPRFQQRLV